MDDIILTKIKSRYKNQSARNEKYNLTPPPVEDYISLVQESIDNGFKCFYCGELMLAIDKKPYPLVFSIDHKTPISSGGKADKTNLCVCHHRCNIAKGTVGYKIFLEMAKNKKLFIKFVKEAFAGGLGYKTERTQLEKELKRGVMLNGSKNK